MTYQDPVELTERVAIAGFLAGYTGNTRTGYTTDLRIFTDWCRNSGLALLEVRRVHLEVFARWMEHEGRMRSTVARRRSTLASFYHYCTAEGIVTRDPSANVRRPTVDHESRTLGLDRNELGALLVQAGLGTPGDHAPGHVAGHERTTDLRSVERRRDGPRHRTGPSHGEDCPQGRQHVTIPLAPRTARALDLYLGERSDGPVFLTAAGRRMDRGAADRTVKRLARRAGISKQISPHSLRHTFITLALDAGVPLRDVQGTASHADPRTTMRYDRGRQSLDRHATYIVAAFVAGASRTN